MFRSSSFQKKKNDVWLNLTFSVPIVECTIRKAVSGKRKWPAQLVNPVKLRRSYITSSTKKNIKIKGWTKEKREYPKIVWLWIRFEWKTSSTMSELKGWRWRHCNWLVTALLACPLVVQLTIRAVQVSGRKRPATREHATESGGQQESFRSNLVKCHQPS